MTQAAINMATDDFTNFTKTVGMIDVNGNNLPLKDFYRKQMDWVFNNVSNGAMDYNTAIRRATQSLSNVGLTTIDYESGYQVSLEAAVRRNIMGGLGLLTEQVTEMNHDDMGANGYEMSAHLNSAQDHEPYQGKQYTDAEWEQLNNELERRVGTLNCGHIAFPIIIGVHELVYSDEELQDMRSENDKGFMFNGKHYTGYEATQRQREIERDIRKWKRKKTAAEATGDAKEIQKATAKLNAKRKEYKAFSEKAGLRTQTERTFTSNVPKGRSAGGVAEEYTDERFFIPQHIKTIDVTNRTEIDMVLGEAQKAFKNSDIEMDITITSDGRVWYTKGTSGNVHAELVETYHGVSLEGSYSYHNHPEESTHYSLSGEDLEVFFKYNVQYSKASDNLYEYYIERTPETINADYNSIWHEFNEAVYKVGYPKFESNIELNVDYDMYHTVMEHLAERYHFIYVRKRL